MDLYTSFTLNTITPFRLDYTVWALRRRNKNIIDQWDGESYKRLLILDKKPIKVTIKQINADLEICLLTKDILDNSDKDQVLQLLQKMLGINLDLSDFYKIAKEDRHVNQLTSDFMGLKPVRFPSLFEALVNAISCQQITIDAGLQIQNRLIEYIGTRLNDEERVIYAFPGYYDIANCSIEELRRIGYSFNKSETLLNIAKSISQNLSQFNNLENLPNKEVVTFLCEHKGIGRWSAEYALLRGLGRIDVFPKDDVGAQRNLQKLLELEEKPDYEEVSSITAKWYPYAGLVYFHLLLKNLKAKGVLANVEHKNQTNI